MKKYKKASGQCLSGAFVSGSSTTREGQVGRAWPAHAPASLSIFSLLLSAPQAQEKHWRAHKKSKENQPLSRANPITRHLNYSQILR